MSETSTLQWEIDQLVKTKLFPDEQAVVRSALRALHVSQPTLRRQMTIRAYTAGEISLEKAAELLGVSHEEMKDILRGEGAEIHLGPRTTDELLRDAAQTYGEEIPLFPVQSDTSVVTHELVNQLRDEIDDKTKSIVDSGSSSTSTRKVTQGEILRELRELDSDRWSEVIDFIGYLKSTSKSAQSQPRELTARELLHSGLVGLWADRDDIDDSLSFARRLRQQAEHRRWSANDSA